jgi:polar amino acid transport system permease protein
MQFDWSFFIDSVISPSDVFLTGLWRTIYIAVIAQTVGTVMGLVVALGARARFGVVRRIAAIYIWLIRGTPLLVQLVLVYNGLAATGVYRFEDARVGPVVLLGVIQAAIITLAMNESAYMAEIIRAALSSIDSGQIEAAKALGMNPFVAMRVVLLPQAMRIVIPPLGNEFNLMMKSTSLLSVIGVQEMFLTAQAINSATFKTFEIFLAAAAYYLLLTTIWGVIQARIERKLSLDKTVSGPRVSLRGRMFTPNASGSRIAPAGADAPDLPIRPRMETNR